MSIGILALVFAGFGAVICLFGIGNDDKPVKEDRRIEYPFPKEI